MSESEKEIPLTETLDLLHKQSRAQAFAVWSLILLSLLLLMAVLVSSAFLYQKVKPLTKQTPEYKFRLIYVEVKQVRKALVEQFKPYDDLQQREDVKKLFAVAKDNENLPVEAEQDLIALIEDYRSALFNLASNISGSGEWHRYHREQLRGYIENARLRVDKLKIMIAKTTVIERH